MALCLMKRLQMAGNKPVVLIGGGTAMVGDPSGRTDMRQMMTKETIQHNADCFYKQLSKFINFDNDSAIIENNKDWLLDLNYVEFLREVAHPLHARRHVLAAVVVGAAHGLHIVPEPDGEVANARKHSHVNSIRASYMGSRTVHR